MLSGAELGLKICAAFDAFAAAPKLPGQETWDSFIDRVYATIVKNDRQAFDALLWILANRKEYVYQNGAGTILTKFDVPCRIELGAFAELVLQNFNASAQETVRYMVKSYGRDAVLAKVRDLGGSDLTAHERSIVECLRYWLGEHPASG